MFDDPVSVQQIESLSFRAQPALETRYYDGWLLRFADGYTRRANSVNPIFGSSLGTHQKIEYCEALYWSRQQDSIFKLTDAAQPSDLDHHLDMLGYKSEAETSVQIGLLTSSQKCEPIHFSERLTAGWLDAYMQLNQVPVDYGATLRRMLSLIGQRTCYMGFLDADQQYVALGMAVLDGDCLGLFDIVTAPHLRRQGLARNLITNLLNWGHDGGAHYAYLQVMLQNDAALSLYQKLGFRQLYRYWYRVRAYSG